MTIQTTSSSDTATIVDVPVRHELGTRIVHAGLAAAIVVQLSSSQVMNPDKAGNTAFALHQYSGLVAFGLVAAFWVLALFRQRGTPFVRLFPWFRRRESFAVWVDFKAHLSSLLRLRLPPHGDITPLASAIHGLGLLLMTAMALSGTVYYVVNTGDPDAGGLVGLTMFVHRTLANLVWAYLVGHVGIALIAHFGGTLSLREMWSFRSGPKR